MRAAMRAASPYLFAMLSPEKIVSDFREHGLMETVEQSGTKLAMLDCLSNLDCYFAAFVVFSCVSLLGVAGLGTACQSLMPPSMALLLAPRATWLGRFS